MRRWRGAGLAALAAVLLVAAGRAQVQQEPLAQTPEGTEITINCSHPTIRTSDYIHWYRQLRGRGPEFLVSFHKGSKDLPDKAGQVSVSPDRRWSTLCLSGPRVGDAAVYYCAVADTARGAGAAAGHEPPRAGPGGAGGTAPAGASRGRSCTSKISFSNHVPPSWAPLFQRAAFQGAFRIGVLNRPKSNLQKSRVQVWLMLPLISPSVENSNISWLLCSRWPLISTSLTNPPLFANSRSGCCINCLTIKNIKIPPMALVFMPEQMQEIIHKTVVAAKRKFHQSQGMRCTCYSIVSPRLAANSSTQTLCGEQGSSEELCTHLQLCWEVQSHNPCPC
ncbi:uncharacterized protein LOC113999063 [Pipra filicauda]|uniref:Uncharacterized protein LOC113999063 n=1 Tax=Pipra filicauda TaxID=649802 RepID=A0A7R5KQY7_9PASS|nr:uncharacterized protein LOC113999063 [Pipra filicauda]